LFCVETFSDKLPSIGIQEIAFKVPTAPTAGEAVLRRVFFLFFG
jgi:hypothetical protein